VDVSHTLKKAENFDFGCPNDKVILTKLIFNLKSVTNSGVIHSRICLIRHLKRIRKKWRIRRTETYTKDRNSVGTG